MSGLLPPEPLVDSHVDLRSYAFMPFYGDFLRASDFNCSATNAEYRAAVNLWWSSWKQVPAASLPDDDAKLCYLADLGRDMRVWAKVKKVAMSGFVLCSDGRWYHEFLAVEARKAWELHATAVKKGRAGAAKRYGKSGSSTITPAIAPAIAIDRTEQDKTENKGGFAPPEWIDAQAWTDFIAMRVKMRKPATQRAKELIVEELDKLRTAGDDPNAVLEQSTRNSWQDVYPLKTKGAQKNGAAADRWWESEAGIIRKGQEIQMQARPGESNASYRDRIRAALDRAGAH